MKKESGSKKDKIGIQLEGETLRFFEHLVSSNLASFKADPKAKNPYAVIKKGSHGEDQITVYAQGFFAADDNFSNAHQAFFAAEDDTPS